MDHGQGARRNRGRTVTVTLTFLVTVILLVAGLLLGGMSLTQAQTKVVVVDDRGQEIVIEEPPERVVVAGTPLYTEILIDVEALELLVGVTSSADNPPEVADVPKIGSSLQPNVEQVIELEPDVVFGAVGDSREQLEDAGLTVVTPIGFITSVPDIFKVARVVGLVVGRQVEAELLIGGISEAIVEVESRVAQRDRPRTAFLFLPSEGPPFAVGRGSVEGEMLARAGAENVFSDIQGVKQVSVEAVIERDPAVIFTDPSQIEKVEGDPRLAEVSAVKDGRVFGVKASALTSTRVAEALRTMASALHPEAFK